MTKSHQQRMLLNFVRTGLRFGNFAEIRLILGEMGLAQVVDYSEILMNALYHPVV